MMSKEDVLTHTNAGDEVDGYGGGVCVGVGWWWVPTSLISMACMQSL